MIGSARMVRLPATLSPPLSVAMEVEMVEREWMPIETAPKDGRSILIWQPANGKGPVKAHEDDFRYAIGYWRRNDGNNSWGDRNSAFVNPTHWMPLPEPPK